MTGNETAAELKALLSSFYTTEQIGEDNNGDDNKYLTSVVNAAGSNSEGSDSSIVKLSAEAIFQLSQEDLIKMGNPQLRIQ